MNQEQHNQAFISTIPEPFEIDWCVFDKHGEEIPCNVTGFFNRDFQEIEELTILDKFKNNITALFDTSEEREEIINIKLS